MIRVVSNNIVILIFLIVDIDPSHWNLDEKTAYERRVYFWNLIQADLWQVSRSLCIRAEVAVVTSLPGLESRDRTSSGACEYMRELSHAN